MSHINRKYDFLSRALIKEVNISHQKNIYVTAKSYLSDTDYSEYKPQNQYSRN